MSAKTTSGPSKSRTTATPKRGRPSASRSAAAEVSPTPADEGDTPATSEAPAAKAPRARRSKTAVPATPDATDAAKPATRRARKVTSPAVETVTEDDAPAAKPAVRRRKAVAEPKTTVDTDETSPAPRRRTTKVADETVTEAAPKRRGRPRKVAAVEQPAPEIVTEDTPKPAEAPRRRGRPRKTDVVATEAPAEKPSAEKAEKKARPTRRKASVPVEEVVAAPVSEETPLAQVESAKSEKDTARRRRARTVVATEPAVTVENIAVPPAIIETVAVAEESFDKPRFADLGLGEPIMRAIEELGYEHPTPIQAQAIPEVLKGHDVLGVAQTGTGKTASFTLPMLQKLSGSRARARMPRSLILEPTRELALQVAENFKLYGKYLRLTHALLIGGESMAEQRDVLNRGVDVLIATPGRLLDLFGRGGLLLTQTSTLVIDEADRMLDMGFIPDIEKIVGLLPAHRQTLFFSATMAEEIRRLADAFLRHPVEITVSRQSSVATTIEEALVIVPEDEKRRTLKKLLRRENVQSAIVFCNRKRDVDMIQQYLTKHGIEAGHLHGDLAQSLRFSTLERFRSGELKFLICSDVAARGIDIGGLSHVFNYDLPFNAEDYVHRIGRTGRAGKEGHAFSLATPRDRRLLEAIETLTGKVIARPVLEGITTVDWAPEEGDRRPTESVSAPVPAPQEASEDGEHRARKRRRGGRKRNRGERNEHESVQQAVPVATPTPVSVIEAPVSHRSVELAPAFENDGPKTGFGGDTPAFMLVPRRRKITVSGETDLAAPVQHDGRHYGNE
ncbi:DEAD/DEAH box helicase [Gluconobacter albidus]|uniref:DEAD/DEAH box helicase n=1 Tax=Gluconobacter albidus TaxID=318683 RepID=UPI002010F1E0|nr:DEAD/DEAH box helicase [Gluconobacter albidus]